MASEWAHATAQAFALWTRVRGSGLRGGRVAFVDGEMGRGVCIHGVAPASYLIYFYKKIWAVSFTHKRLLPPFPERLSIRSIAQGAALEALLGCDCRVYG